MVLVVWFLDFFSGKFQEITEQSTRTMSESTWAAVLGTHVLRKLAVSDEMMVDIGYAGKKAECPCGCQTPIVFGDTSIGKLTWIISSPDCL